SSCWDFDCVLFVAAYGTFLMPGACLRSGSFRINYPLKGMFRLVYGFAAFTGIPMVGFVILPVAFCHAGVCGNCDSHSGGCKSCSVCLYTDFIGSVGKSRNGITGNVRPNGSRGQL